LAGAIDLALRCKHAHWNVVGLTFIGAHKLFDKLADNAYGYADTIAEQARFLGSAAPGTVTSVDKASPLSGYTPMVAPAATHFKAIVASLEALAKETRKAIKIYLDRGDQATADVFIEVTRALQHDIYLAQSRLQ
jgi:starvation-inducible DNA-binding protein